MISDEERDRLMSLPGDEMDKSLSDQYAAHLKQAKSAEPPGGDRRPWPRGHGPGPPAVPATGAGPRIATDRTWARIPRTAGPTAAREVDLRKSAGGNIGPEKALTEKLRPRGSLRRRKSGGTLEFRCLTASSSPCPSRD